MALKNLKHLKLPKTLTQQAYPNIPPNVHNMHFIKLPIELQRHDTIINQAIINNTINKHKKNSTIFNKKFMEEQKKKKKKKKKKKVFL
jgi:hypothetical protein